MLDLLFKLEVRGLGDHCRFLLFVFLILLTMFFRLTYFLRRPSICLKSIERDAIVFNWRRLPIISVLTTLRAVVSCCVLRVVGGLAASTLPDGAQLPRQTTLQLFLDVLGARVRK